MLTDDHERPRRPLHASSGAGTGAGSASSSRSADFNNHSVASMGRAYLSQATWAQANNAALAYNIKPAMESGRNLKTAITANAQNRMIRAGLGMTERTAISKYPIVGTGGLTFSMDGKNKKQMEIATAIAIA